MNARCLPAIFLSILTTTLLAAVLSCGGGGGSSSDTTIEGNILDTATGAPAQPTMLSRILTALDPVRDALAVVEGVQVSVRDTDLVTTTDENGFFQFEGDFPDQVILDFLAPEGAASLTVEAPPGMRVVLQDVRLDIPAGQAVAAETVLIDENPPEPETNANDNLNGNDNTDANVNGNDNTVVNGNANDNTVVNGNDNANGNVAVNDNTDVNDNIDDLDDVDDLGENSNVNVNDNIDDDDPLDDLDNVDDDVGDAIDDVDDDVTDAIDDLDDDIDDAI